MRLYRLLYVCLAASHFFSHECVTHANCHTVHGFMPSFLPAQCIHHQRRTSNLASPGPHANCKATSPVCMVDARCLALAGTHSPTAQQHVAPIAGRRHERGKLARICAL